MRGREHPIVLPDATRTALLAQCSPSIAVYASAPPTARCIPQVDVTGIEPATACLQSPGLSTFDHTLRFFFPDYRLGNLTQWRADGRPLLASASGSRGARPEPPINAGVTTRALCTQGISHCLHRCCRRAGRTSPKLARYQCNQGNFPCPGTGYRRFFSPPLRPI